MQSCCAATPHKVDLTWLKQNSDNLFNIPILQQERREMLNGIPVASCEDTCWQAERRGIASRRTVMKSDVQTHTDVDAEPEVLHINVGSDCNLTCVYCTKQYSTAWLHDIANNGSYLDDQRFKINTQDRVLLKLGQKQIDQTDSYQTLLNAATKYQNSTVVISGGEPFLNNNLVEIVKKFKRPVTIYTGLGINTARLERVLTELPSTVEFIISAETTGNNYEFVRYGNTWEQFQTNLALIQQFGKIKFSSVLSNLTILWFYEFEQQFKNIEIIPNFCTDPAYLGIHMLDKHSKDIIQSTQFVTANTEIKNNLNIEPTAEQHIQLRTYLNEYARRRNLSLDIFPTSFTTWLNIP